MERLKERNEVADSFISSQNGESKYACCTSLPQSVTSETTQDVAYRRKMIMDALLRGTKSSQLESMLKDSEEEVREDGSKR